MISLSELADYVMPIVPAKTSDFALVFGTRHGVEVLYERAMALGVPQEAMLLECNARNTGENVLMTRELLRGHPRLSKAASVLAVGKISSIRRYLMTIAQHMPHLSTSMYPVNFYGVGREQWHTDPAFHARVMAEYKKIPAYLQAGYLTEIKIDTALSLPRTSMPSPLLFGTAATCVSIRR